MFDILRPLFEQRYLLQQLVQREIYGKYRRSRYGLMWIFIQPLLLLAGYTLVFGVFLKARWGGAEASSSSDGSTMQAPRSPQWANRAWGKASD